MPPAFIKRSTNKAIQANALWWRIGERRIKRPPPRFQSGSRHSEFGPLVRFAYGLQRDISAIAAAVTTSWSSGQVEGQINRLKTIKRQMYRRTGFELLRARVLPYSSAATAGPAP